ncbi:MAG: glycosyltransferase family 2 protein [Actinomycetota bacterium]
MYQGLSIAAVIPVLDEESKIGTVLSRIPRDIVDEIVVVDDGSTDSSPKIAVESGATLITMPRTVGVGAALRRGFEHVCEKGHDVTVVIAGNNKDSPEEIPLLLDPIVRGDADFVQGSRWLTRNAQLGPMPLYRRIATRIHPLIFSLAARRRTTDSTNGFRAFSNRILADETISLDQAWLDGYELEPYLYLRVARSSYKTIEVPVTKTYPPKHLGQTKMPPVVGWWEILRPVVLVGLGLKR